MDIKELFKKLTKQDKEEFERLIDEEIEQAHLKNIEDNSRANQETAERLRKARKLQIKKTNIRKQQIKESKISPARRMRLRKLGKI